jgi:hypothetical protein
MDVARRDARKNSRVSEESRMRSYSVCVCVYV